MGLADRTEFDDFTRLGPRSRRAWFSHVEIVPRSDEVWPESDAGAAGKGGSAEIMVG
jgi:hypothetical protein